MGCINKSNQLKYLYKYDKNISTSDRGWIKQELNRNKQNIRNPPGKHLAHERGREKAKGYGYEHSKLQIISNHKLQHKFDNMGKNNKERPFDLLYL
tara:strand:+ start:166 stop:453 length:288 start_codon:yes stop_codon:yes gene_type:complete